MQGDYIFETQDGSHSIFSETHEVSYHSKYGAIQESQHVFIEAGLYHKRLEKKEISILEIGFGTGLNALMTLLEAEKQQLQIYYESIEAFPINEVQAATLNYTSKLQAEDYQATFLKMHELEWNTEVELTANFRFKKVLQKFEAIHYKPQFDIIYFVSILILHEIAISHFPVILNRFFGNHMFSNLF